MLNSEIPWARIAAIWAELATAPVNAPDEALHHLFDLICELTRADDAICVVALRSLPRADWDTDPLHGWRWMHTFRYDDRHDVTFANFWSQDPKNTIHSRVLQKAVEGFGSHRALLKHDVIGDASWSESRVGPLFAHYGIKDRITAAYSLSSDIEVFFTVDRKKSARPFGEKERDILLATLPGVGPICLRLAMSFGFVGSKMKLTPRERETLIHLLDKKSEKEIADEMGLTVRSAHQYVVSIYRKFEVNSRAELMALWMSTPPMRQTRDDVARFATLDEDSEGISG